MVGHNPKRTIVQVLLNLSKGGMESMAVNLACKLRKTGFEVVVIVLDHGGEHEVQLQAADIPYEILGGRQLKNPRYHLRIAAVLRNVRAQVVHTHHLPSLLGAAVATKLAGVHRLVHTEHSYEYLESRWDYRLMLRWISRRYDAFVVVANSMERYYRNQVRIPAHRLHVVPNGVDLFRYKPSDDVHALRRALGLPGGVLFGTAGRFFPVKRYDDLLRAMALVDARSSIRLVMIGDGPERTRLEELAAELGIRDRVFFPGWRTDLAKWLPALDVFVMTSDSEGLPLAALEAMASAVPIVVTPVGDLPHVITDGHEGFLVPVGDTKTLANRLLQLVDDVELRSSMGLHARESVSRRYSEESMVERYTKLYNA